MTFGRETVEKEMISSVASAGRDHLQHDDHVNSHLCGDLSWHIGFTHGQFHSNEAVGEARPPPGQTSVNNNSSHVQTHVHTNLPRFPESGGSWKI